MTKEDFEIILEIILMLLGLYLAFVKSYFQEKGKNLATIEDIEKITLKVEAIKTEFVKETEKLKANLSLLTNVQVGLVAEERNAIINYNEKYFKWLNILIDIHFGSVDDSDSDDLDKQSRRLGEYYNDYLESESRFSLFVENQPLIEYSNNMKLETLRKLGTLAAKCLQDLKFNIIEIDHVKKSAFTLAEQSVKLAELRDKKMSYYSEFRDAMLAGYREIVPMNKIFQKMCREHIYQIIKIREDQIV